MADEDVQEGAKKDLYSELPSELRAKITRAVYSLHRWCVTNRANLQLCHSLQPFWNQFFDNERRYWEEQYQFNGVVGVPMDSERQDVPRFTPRPTGFERILDLIHRRNGVKNPANMLAEMSFNEACAQLLDARNWAPRHWRGGRTRFYGVGELREAIHDFLKGGDAKQTVIAKYGEPEAWIVSAVRNFNSLNDGGSGENTFNEPIGAWDTSRATEMRYTFHNFRHFNQPIGSWDTSRVQSMVHMFVHAFAFNQPIGDWDTSRVLTMRGMFMNAHDFNQPIGDWSTSNVRDMISMFSGARVFNQPIGDWDTSQVKTMHGMFRGAKRFNQPIQSNPNRQKWQTYQVIDMSYMFYDAEDFNQFIGNWNTDNVTNMAQMFAFALSFDKPLNRQTFGHWNTGKVRTMAAMFKQAESFNQDIADWNTQSVTDMSEMFKHARAFNQPIGDWDTSNVELMDDVFVGAINFIQDISKWSVESARPSSKDYIEKMKAQMTRRVSSQGVFERARAQSVVEAVFEFYGLDL